MLLSGCGAEPSPPAPHPGSILACLRASISAAVGPQAAPAPPPAPWQLLPSPPSLPPPPPPLPPSPSPHVGTLLAREAGVPWRAAIRVACRLAELRTNWAIMLAADAVPPVPPSVSSGGVCILESSCAYVARAHRPHRKKEREGGTTSQKRKGAKPGHTELRGRSDCYVPRLWLSEVTRRGRGARGDRRNPREYAMLVSLNPRGAPPAP